MSDDREAEADAIQKLAACGYRVRREHGGIRDGWWIVENVATEIETASMDNLPALVELANALSGSQTGQQLTPSA